MSREELRDQVTSGGLADFLIYVERASFAVDPQYSEKTGNDVVFLHWEGPTNLEDRPMMTVNDFHPKWAMDPDFATPDGKTVVSQSGKKKKVGKAYGRMCNQAAEATSAFEGKANDPLAGISAFDAATWQGHTWRLDNVDFDFGGEIGKRTELHPVEYVGPGNLTGASQPAPAAAAAPAPAAPAPAPAPAPAAAPAAAQGDPLMAQVEALAAQSADFASFKQAALALEGVTDRTDLLIAISDQNQVWARIRPNG